MEFFKSGEYDWLKITLLILLIIGAGVFVSQFSHKRNTLTQATVFDATPKKLISTHISANILDPQINILMDSRLSLWKALNLTNYYFSPYPGTMDSSDVVTLQNFAQQTGAQIDTYFDMPNMTNADMDKQLSDLHPEFIEFNQESQAGRNVIDNTVYVSLATAFISYLNNRAIPVLDGALVYRHTSDTDARRIAVGAITGFTYDVRQYIQPGDIVSYTSDMNANATNLNGYFTNTSPSAQSLPAFLNTFLEYYPHARKEAVIQWNVEDATGTPLVAGTALENSAMGRTVEFVLRNTDHISYLAWMSLGNLVAHDSHGDTPRVAYYALKRLAQVFHYKFEQDYNIGLAGVTALLFSNDDGTSALLINNPTGTTYTSIPNTDFPNLILNSSGKNFSRDTGYVTAWGNAPTNEIVTEDNITVRPYSVSVVKFTVGQSSGGTETGAPPTVPQNLHEQSTTSSSATLSWNPSTDESGSVAHYTVYEIAPDTVPPVITLLGANPMSVTKGSTFTDPAATATDNVDGSITNSITVSGTVNTAAIGTYTLTYSVTDSAGNTATTNRTVNVIASGGAGGGGGGNAIASRIHLELMSTQAEERIGEAPYVIVLPANYQTNAGTKQLIKDSLTHSYDVLNHTTYEDSSHFPYVYYLLGVNNIMNSFVYVSMRNIGGGSTDSVAATQVGDWLFSVANEWAAGAMLMLNTNATLYKIAWGTNAEALPVDCADDLDNDVDGVNNFPSDPGCTSNSDPDERDFVPSDITGPVITGVTVAVGQTSTVVTWHTDEEASSKVEYGQVTSQFLPMRPYENETTETDTSSRVKDHSVTLTSLTPNTPYHYRIRSIDAFNNLTMTIDYPFTTLALSGASIPTITGSTPFSNSNNNDPLIFGDAESGTTVKIYTTLHCTGTPAAVGSAESFHGLGFSVHVADNTVTAFYASATDASGNVSGCSTRYAYSEVSP